MALDRMTWRDARRAARLAGLGLVTLLLALPALSERAWIKDELRINLRTGPGVQFRIMGRLKTGDAVEILERGEGWTKIRVAEFGDGWIPEGYLAPAPPARLRLDQSESQTEELRARVETLTTRTTELEGENASLSGRDEEQQSTIERLTRENLELRAGARWPHWITGAGILVSGMLLGMLMRGAAGRRSRPRIRF